MPHEQIAVVLALVRHSSNGIAGPCACQGERLRLVSVGPMLVLHYNLHVVVHTTVVMGLGNPGPAYAGTRHNVGFRCVDHFARRHDGRFTRTAARSRLAEVQVDGLRIILAKPRTFMNLSGLAAVSLVQSFRIPVQNLIVVYDEVALPLGTLRVRASGGHGGHNGMKSIISALDSEQFARIRIGIGSADEETSSLAANGSLVDFVLSRFTSAEEKVLGEVIDTATDALTCALTKGIDTAMNRYN